MQTPCIANYSTTDLKSSIQLTVYYGTEQTEHGSPNKLVLNNEYHCSSLEIGDWIAIGLIDDDETHEIVEKQGEVFVLKDAFISMTSETPSDILHLHVEQLSTFGWQIMQYDGFWKNSQFGLKTSDRLKTLTNKLKFWR